MLAIAGFAIVAFVLAAVIVMGVAYALPRFRHLNRADLAQSVTLLFVIQAVAYVMLVGFMVQLVRLKRRGHFLEAISWRSPDLERALLAIAGGAGLAILSSVFTLLLSRWVPKSLPIDKLFRDTNSAYLLALFGILVAPFVEEVFFRGFLYPALARPLGVPSSLFLTAAAFAIIHQGQLARAWVPLSWLFIVGLVLTIVRAKTKSVASCVLVHIAYNTTLFTFVFVGTHGFRQLDHY